MGSFILKAIFALSLTSLIEMEKPRVWMQSMHLLVLQSQMTSFRAREPRWLSNLATVRASAIDETKLIESP